jgi:hypothetical protein
MRKSVVTPFSERASKGDPASDVESRWLDLDALAQIEVTSEDPKYPVEGALVGGDDRGWRAAEPGPQTIRILFDRPVPVRQMRLVFIEPDVTRTQEFAIRWSGDDAPSLRDVVRQQWNFTPAGSTREVEDYRVELADVSALELTIVPDVSGGAARASLAQWRIA